LSLSDVGEHAVSVEPFSGVASEVVAGTDTSVNNPRGVEGTISGDTHAETSTSGVSGHGSIARPRADGFDNTDETVGVTLE